MTTTGGFIEECEREPLHLSGAIQPHGALLIVDTEDRVTHASENIDQFLPPAPDIIGTAVPGAIASVVSGLGIEPGRRASRLNIDLEGGAASVVATRSENGSVTVELLPSLSEEGSATPMPILAYGEFTDEEALTAARQHLVKHIQVHTGFERVLYYEFHDDETGEVAAEAVSTTAKGSYFGLRFPASDIPQVARNLYMKASWRTIPDSAAAPVNILGQGGTPPDLSLVDLRSVSPVHLSYMQNMGVAGAVSVPVKTASRLQALISCHSPEPKTLSLQALQALADQVATYNLRVREFMSSRRMNLLGQLETRLRHWRDQLLGEGSRVEAWSDFIQYLQEEFQADGVLLDTGTQVYQTGLVPESEAIGIIQRWLGGSQAVGGVTVSQSVVRDCPQPVLTEVAGLAGFSMRLTESVHLDCYFFRQEELQEVAWGGNPNKPEEQAVGPHPIAPRRSFERWIETRLGYSREWPEQTRLKLLTLRGFLAGLVT